ncbi:MAG: hypothetical protein EOQ27_04035 [Mesorhizobium sp.]|nr:MAG: hypothetical protein EOQ27_04035 [Mesorhizobium sp.]
MDRQEQAGRQGEELRRSTVFALRVLGLRPADARCQFYPSGHLPRVSALPVLTDFNVRSAPVLETRTS